MPCGQKALQQPASHAGTKLVELLSLGFSSHLKLLTGALPPPGMLSPGCPSFWGWCSCPGMTSRWFWALRFWLWFPPLLPLPGMNRPPLSPPEPPPRHTVAFRPACSLFSVHEHGCCRNSPACMAALQAQELVVEWVAVSKPSYVDQAGCTASCKRKIKQLTAALAHFNIGCTGGHCTWDRRVLSECCSSRA